MQLAVLIGCRTALLVAMIYKVTAVEGEAASQLIEGQPLARKASDTYVQPSV